jgi:hypothetical protein
LQSSSQKASTVVGTAMTNLLAGEKTH